MDKLPSLVLACLIGLFCLALSVVVAYSYRKQVVEKRRKAA